VPASVWWGKRAARDRVSNLEEVEVIELIDDWKHELVPPARRGRAAPKAISPDEIRDELAKLSPQVLNVNCYDDVEYPWVQVVFDEVITPAVALRAGAAVAAAAGPEYVYFNSLRPKSVYFVLDLPADKPDLKASRYGTLLSEIEAAWIEPAKNASKRAASGRRRPAASR